MRLQRFPIIPGAALITLFIFSFSLWSQTPGSGNVARDSFRWNAGRGYRPFRYASPEGIIIDNLTADTLSDIIHLPEAARSYTLSFKGANLHAHPQKRFPHINAKGEACRVRDPEWSLILISSGADTTILRFRSRESDDPNNPGRKIIISAEGRAISEGAISAEMSDGFDPNPGFNLWHISVDNSTATLHGGNRRLLPVFSFPISDCASFGFAAAPGALLKVTDITLTRRISPPSPPQWASVAQIESHLAESRDSLEGYWTLFDRNLEESLLMPGGDYHLAMVRDGRRYLLLYLSGARVNNKKWRQGMVKAILTPDLFPEIFNVVWYDAEGLPLSNALKAQLGEGNTISIQFPYQNSSIRLRKINR